MKSGPRSLAIFVLVWCCCICPGLVKSAQTDPHIEAAALLEESYASSAKLDPTERVYYLERLTRIAAEISHDKTEAWCMELYRLAANIKPDWASVAAQKNALVALARVNPRKAMELLRGLGAPDYPYGNPPEDLRADAAITIFPYYRRVVGPSALPDVEGEARRIGDSGEYPYHAMATVIQDLSRSQSDELKGEPTKILGDALSSYQKPSIYADANEGFLGILENAEFGTSQITYGQALQFFVKRLQSDADKVIPNFPGRIDTAKGTSRFPNGSRLLLFRVWPLVARFNKSWADELSNKYPELKNASDDIQNIEQGVFEGTPTADQAAQLQKQVDEHAALAQIAYLQQVNPWAALDLAQKLPNPSGRILGLSTILPTMTQVDLAQAKNIYTQQLEDVAGIEDASSNLTAYVALAKSAYYLGDADGFSDYVGKALDVGTRLFERDENANSSKHVFERPGYDELSDLVEFCTEHGVTWVVGALRERQDNALKTYLLAFASKGTYRQPSTVAQHPPEEPPAVATGLDKTQKK